MIDAHGRADRAATPSKWARGWLARKPRMRSLPRRYGLQVETAWSGRAHVASNAEAR
jgi:hypothetical protein